MVATEFSRCGGILRSAILCDYILLNDRQSYPTKLRPFREFRRSVPKPGIFTCCGQYAEIRDGMYTNPGRIFAFARAARFRSKKRRRLCQGGIPDAPCHTCRIYGTDMEDVFP